MKDFATGKAKAEGVSSPTPSTGLKACLALASFCHMTLAALDVSAAFMHTPLKSRKYIIKCPLSLTWGDGSPMYLELKRALNGLRPASGEWLAYVTSILAPLGLASDAREPCILSGAEGLVVVYGDDILCCGLDKMFYEKIHKLLNTVVPTKLTGVIDGTKGGQLRFVGRIIVRLPNDSKLFISTDPNYLDSTFEEFQIGGGKDRKGTGVSVPGIRATLESVDDSPALSPEGHARFRRVLGKLAWLSQTLEYLHIFICLLATGQQAPTENMRKAFDKFYGFSFMMG